MLRHRLAALALALIAAIGSGSIATADPSDRGSFTQINPEDRDYLAGLARPGLVRHAGRAEDAGPVGPVDLRPRWSPRRGSRATVIQTGTNNSATVRQRGNNKTVIIVQRGSNTDVTIDQHGDGPGGAFVYTW